MPNKRLKRARNQIQLLTSQLQKQKLKVLKLQEKIQNMLSTNLLQKQLNQKSQMEAKEFLKANSVPKSDTSTHSIACQVQLKLGEIDFKQSQKLKSLQLLVLENKKILSQTIKSCYGPNHFDQGPRYHILGFCQKIIKLVQNSAIEKEKNNILFNVPSENKQNKLLLNVQTKLKNNLSKNEVFINMKQISNPERPELVQKKESSQKVPQSVKRQIVKIIQVKQKQKQIAPTFQEELKWLKQLQQQVMNNRQTLTSTIGKYDSSNYFHVDPRYHMLGFCRRVIGIAERNNTKIQSEEYLKQEQSKDLGDVNKLKKWFKIKKYILQNKQQLQSTIRQYNSSNYFHVGPRYHMLGFCRQLISEFSQKGEKTNY